MFIKVKVFPNSKKEEVTQKSSDDFEIKVKAAPRQGAANSRTVELLAGFLKIPAGRLRLIKGAKTRNKIFKVDYSRYSKNN